MTLILHLNPDVGATHPNFWLENAKRAVDTALYASVASRTGGGGGARPQRAQVASFYTALIGASSIVQPSASDPQAPMEEVALGALVAQLSLRVQEQRRVPAAADNLGAVALEEAQSLLLSAPAAAALRNGVLPRRAGGAMSMLVSFVATAPVPQPVRAAALAEQLAPLAICGASGGNARLVASLACSLDTVGGLSGGQVAREIVKQVAELGLTQIMSNRGPSLTLFHTQLTPSLRTAWSAALSQTVLRFNAPTPPELAAGLDASVEEQPISMIERQQMIAAHMERKRELDVTLSELSGVDLAQLGFQPADGGGSSGGVSARGVASQWWVRVRVPRHVRIIADDRRRGTGFIPRISGAAASSAAERFSDELLAVLEAQFVGASGGGDGNDAARVVAAALPAVFNAAAGTAAASVGGGGGGGGYWPREQQDNAALGTALSAAAAVLGAALRARSGPPGGGVGAVAVAEAEGAFVAGLGEASQHMIIALMTAVGFESALQRVAADELHRSLAAAEREVLQIAQLGAPAHAPMLPLAYTAAAAVLGRRLTDALLALVPTPRPVLCALLATTPRLLAARNALGHAVVITALRSTVAFLTEPTREPLNRFFPPPQLRDALALQGGEAVAAGSDVDRTLNQLRALLRDAHNSLRSGNVWRDEIIAMRPQRGSGAGGGGGGGGGGVVGWGAGGVAWAGGGGGGAAAAAANAAAARVRGFEDFGALIRSAHILNADEAFIATQDRLAELESSFPAEIANIERAQAVFNFLRTRGLLSAFSAAPPSAAGNPNLRALRTGVQDALASLEVSDETAKCLMHFVGGGSRIFGPQFDAARQAAAPQAQQQAVGFIGRIMGQQAEAAAAHDANDVQGLAAQINAASSRAVANLVVCVQPGATLLQLKAMASAGAADGSGGGGSATSDIDIKLVIEFAMQQGGRRGASIDPARIQ